MSETRACWYRTIVKWEWKNSTRIPTYSGPLAGEFHAWSLEHEEYDGGPGHYAAAIVEDAKTGAVHVRPARDVCFGNAPDFGDGDAK